jgi:hypothetical protein
MGASMFKNSFRLSTNCRQAAAAIFGEMAEAKAVSIQIVAY